MATKGTQMAKKRLNANSEWRQFEQLVAKVEELMASEGAIVKSPDRIKDIETGRLREVDASIRVEVGSIEVLVTVECRRRSRKADVTWIEQLATKRKRIGASKTIAVSTSGFSAGAQECASRYGIELRIFGEISTLDIASWFKPETFIHSYREVSSFRCEVLLESGHSEVIEGGQPRFRHPMVHGDFPAWAFFNFIEMQNPDAFERNHQDETERQVRFELAGADANLIPVPLGEQKKLGVLLIKVDEQYFEVAKLIITATLKYHSEMLVPDQGKHFLYGSLEKPNALLSDYSSEMFGLPVKIERFQSEKKRAGTANITFPSGLKLPGELTSTRIKDVSNFDTNQIALAPILLKVRGSPELKARILGQDFVERTKNQFLHPENLDRDHILFVEEHYWQMMIRALQNEKSDEVIPRDMFKYVRKGAVEYIDLSTAVERPKS